MANETLKKFKESWLDFKTQAKICIKEALNKETRKKQIPNMFTASRLLAPLFIIPTALTGNILLTIIFSIMFALTDAADGFFARKYKATSEFGRKLDPITDKVFAGSLLIPLMTINPLMIINFIGEATIAGINTHSQFSENVPKTVFIGKIKTNALYSMIALSYITLSFGSIPIFIDWLIGGTALLQLGTAYEYYKIFKEDETAKNISIVEDDYNKQIIENEMENEKEQFNKEKTIEKQILDLQGYKKCILEENEEITNKEEKQKIKNKF